MMIYAVVVSHANGVDLFTCASDELRTKALAGFCREWWDETLGPVPVGDQAVVERYFKGNDYEYTEYFDQEVIGA